MNQWKYVFFKVTSPTVIVLNCIVIEVHTSIKQKTVIPQYLFEPH